MSGCVVNVTRKLTSLPALMKPEVASVMRDSVSSVVNLHTVAGIAADRLAMGYAFARNATDICASDRPKKRMVVVLQRGAASSRLSQHRPNAPEYLLLRTKFKSALK